MHLGVAILPELRAAEARAVWARAEALGFDHAWTYDHIAWSTLRDSTWFGAVPTLTAAATATARIRLGPLVASPNFRHPVPFARDLLALDDISGGRITLGIGAGGTGWDASVLGGEPWSRQERTERFEEFVDLLDRLLRSPRTTYDGQHYRAVDAPMEPGCVQRPRLPFAVAATGPRGMALAARFADTWVTYGDPRHEGPPLAAADGARVVAAQMATLDEICDAHGRDPSTLSRLVLDGVRLDAGLTSPQAFVDTLGAYAAVGVTDLVVHWPRPTPPYQGGVASFEAAVTAAVGHPDPGGEPG